MKRIICMWALLTIALAYVGTAQDINGKWKGEMQTQNGPMDMTFNFKVNADSLTGSVESPMGEIPISNGKINGNKSFDVSFNEMTIKHECTIAADSIAMKVPGMGDGNAMELTLRRSKDTK